jgi:hypothetical protein
MEWLAATGDGSVDCMLDGIVDSLVTGLPSRIWGTFV